MTKKYSPRPAGPRALAEITAARTPRKTLAKRTPMVPDIADLKPECSPAGQRMRKPTDPDLETESM